MAISTQNSPTYTEQMEVVNGLIGILAGEIGKKYGKTLGVAAASILTGNSGAMTGMVDLINKIKNGTATSDDFVDVAEPIANILAGVGVATGVLNPAFLGAMGAIGLLRLGLDAIDPNSPLRQMLDKIDYESLLSNINPQEALNSFTPEEKQRLQDMGFIPYDPNDLPYDPTNFDPNTPERDTDNDGIPDWLDPDMDGDGIPDGADSDRDGDGIPDEIDPDPLTPEPNQGDGHPLPYDPTRPGMHDPLALDMNQDGEISTISLADSQVYFDLTGDGVKEKVGWISASEGIVAFDKNGNGKIDGIGEVFGTATTSGFAELRALADSNYDGVIDRRDELYNQLKVWQDANQDGISQANELKTLAEAGVNNIELDVFATNINLNGNLLTEAGRYSDSTGTRSLAADVELTFDARITTVDTSLIPDYTVHPESQSLPKLRGYGTVYNSEIAYNVNPNLLTLAQSLTSDPSTVAKNFDEFIAEWSGLNTLLRNAQDKYALTSAPILSEMDKKVWIYEHFMGDSRFSSGIESRINATASAMKTGGSANVGAGRYTDSKQYLKSNSTQRKAA